MEDKPAVYLDKVRKFKAEAFDNVALNSAGAMYLEEFSDFLVHVDVQLEKLRLKVRRLSPASGLRAELLGGRITPSSQRMAFHREVNVLLGRLFHQDGGLERYTQYRHFLQPEAYSAVQQSTLKLKDFLRAQVALIFLGKEKISNVSLVASFSQALLKYYWGMERRVLTKLVESFGYEMLSAAGLRRVSQALNGYMLALHEAYTEPVNRRLSILRACSQCSSHVAEMEARLREYSRAFEERREFILASLKLWLPLDHDIRQWVAAVTQSLLNQLKLAFDPEPLLDSDERPITGTGNQQLQELLESGARIAGSCKHNCEQQIAELPPAELIRPIDFAEILEEEDIVTAAVAKKS